MIEPILLNNLQINGVPFEEVSNLHINNTLDTYGAAVIEGYMSAGTANSFSSRSQNNTVTIATTAQGQPATLFLGIMSNCELLHSEAECKVRVTLHGQASKLDVTPENHSYQNTGATYEDLMNQSLNGQADLKVNASDHATGQLIVQYNETPWKFCERMASSLGVTICTSVTAPFPTIYVGKPSGNKTYEVVTNSYVASSQGIQITTNQYCELGDKVSFQQGGGVVTSVEAYMDRGRLLTSVFLANELEVNPSNQISVKNLATQEIGTAYGAKLYAEIMKTPDIYKLATIDQEGIDAGGSAFLGGDLDVPKGTLDDSSHFGFGTFKEGDGSTTSGNGGTGAGTGSSGGGGDALTGGGAGSSGGGSGNSSGGGMGTGAGSVANGGQQGNFAKAPMTNNAVSGRMFTGEVQGVDRDRVQVFLSSIDSEYAAGDWWFPYSTAYSSSDGSGFYYMPQVGDKVHVFFPSGNEGEAFAASSENSFPLNKPENKKWRSPAGKEILFTEKGIMISMKTHKVYIDLLEEDGITIASDSDINISAMRNMMLYAKESMSVKADKKILLSTGASFIEMTEEQIRLAGDQVIIK